MAYRDLRDFIRALEKNDELKRIPFEVDPDPRDHRVRRPRREAGRPRAAVREAQGLHRPGADQRLRQRCARWRSRWKWTRWTKWRGASSEFLEMRMPEGLIGKLKMLPKLAEMGAFFPKIVSKGAVPGSRAHATDSRSSTIPVLQCWPEDGGRFITLPLVFSRNPDTGKRNCGMYRMQVFDERTAGHALADPQAGRRALPPHAAPRAASAWTWPWPSAPTRPPCTRRSCRCRPTSTR